MKASARSSGERVASGETRPDSENRKTTNTEEEQSSKQKKIAKTILDQNGTDQATKSKIRKSKNPALIPCRKTEEENL